MLNAPGCVFPPVHPQCVHQTLQSKRGEHDLQHYDINTRVFSLLCVQAALQMT